MPKQKSPFTFTGTAGEISFYYNKLYGPVMRTKGGPSKAKIKKDPVFEPVRKNYTEFGRASAYAKTIRHAFHLLEQHCKDGTMNTRLVVRIREFILMDTAHEWGKRDLSPETLKQFRHFELDRNSLSSLYFELPLATETANGQLDIYAGIRLGKKPTGIDAWKVLSVGAGIDLANGKRVTDLKESDIYEFEKGSFGLGFRHYYDEAHLLFHGMCVVFYRYDAGIDEYVPLKTEHVNAGFIRFLC
jgi:hypothetical protein